ncbi:calmodulin-binding protein [Wolffia australiana]
MEGVRLGDIFVFFAASLLLIAGSAYCAASRETLGISPIDADYYRQNVIRCKDGSSKFAIEQLNDDFCDCPDGTDEPGTSACPEGKFYCQNKGHTPLIIFSSRVNDGICDCCDGSDEYNGKVDCANTCWEAGKVARERLTKKISTHRDGIALRIIEVEKAKKAFEEDGAELSKLKTEEKVLKGIVERLKEHKEQIEKAEEQERLKKEKEEDALKNSQKASENGPTNGKTEDGSEQYTNASEGIQEPKSDDGDVSSDHHDEQILEEEKDSEDAKTTDASNNEEKQGNEDQDSIEGLSKEELGRRVASRWTGEKTTPETKGEEEAEKLEIQEKDSAASGNHDEINPGYNSEPEESGPKYNDDDDHDDEESDHGHSDDEYEDELEPSHTHSNNEAEDDAEFSDYTETTSTMSWSEKIQRTVQNILQRISLFKSPVDVSDAARIRKEYDESTSKLTKIQSRISKLTAKLKHDFGVDKEFYFFYDECFETKQDKYVYKVCPFKDASQVEGYSNTRLGSWDKFEDSYRLMIFSHGEKCWNGPDRTLKVRLRCGLKNEVNHVDEPSRCEYSAILSTPALCLEEKLKDLENKLKRLNTGDLQPHDEL